MILVFIFLGLILIISLLITMLLFSSIKIKIYNFKLHNLKLEKENYKIYLQIYLFNKIKIFSLKIDDKKIKRLTINTKIRKQEIKKILNNNIFKIVKKLHLKFERLRLIVDIGVENAAVVACLTSTLSGIIGINMLKKANIKDIVENNFYYKINPIYNQNVLKINLVESIINIKIVHIISMLIYGRKKGELLKWRNIQ